MIKKTKIEVKNFNKIIGAKRILKNISFTLDQEEHLVIIGSSGAGKSMLVKCLLGLEDLSSGSIFFDGTPINGNDTKQSLLKKLGVCFQSNALFDSYKIWENIAFKSLYNENSPNILKLKKLAMKKLEEVGLPINVAELYPSELSGGMQKRVGIARALYRDPQILVLDEATSSLDQTNENKIIKDIFANISKTLIIVSHKTETLKFCDKILEISDLSYFLHKSFSDFIKNKNENTI